MNSSSANPIGPYLEQLFGRIDYERQVPDSAKNFDLSKMRGLMQRLGNPENSASVIHVAGTKGKGSVCVMLGAALSSAGMKTGVYTSPHLETIHQRMAIDGQLITDSQMAAAFERIDAKVQEFDRTLLADGKQPVSFFEYTTALAFDFFAAEKCDAVVLETGLGGRLDSTNVCQPEVCVITNISRDHTRILGDTLEEIAGEKAGIIKQGVPVVSGVTDSPSREVIAQVVKERGSDLYLRNSAFEIGESTDEESFSFQMNAGAKSAPIADLKLKMRGSHQRANASLAVATMMVLREKGWNISDTAIRDGLANASLPGRIEILGSRPTVLMDMAHNPASVEALAQMLQEDLPAYKAALERTLVFGTTRDKDCQKMLERIIPLFDRVIFTKYKNNPRGLSVAKLVKLSEPVINDCNANGKTIEVETNEDPILAWNRSITIPHEQKFICVAGSAFLIAEVRPKVLEFLDRN
jgi:dihydrofolate synthase/folylpolyglutamate synthase